MARHKNLPFAFYMPNILPLNGKLEHFLYCFVFRRLNYREGYGYLMVNVVIFSPFISEVSRVLVELLWTLVPSRL